MYVIYTNEGPGAEAELKRLVRPLEKLRPQSSAMQRIPAAQLEDLMVSGWRQRGEGGGLRVPGVLVAGCWQRARQLQPPDPSQPSN